MILRRTIFFHKVTFYDYFFSLFKAPVMQIINMYFLLHFRVNFSLLLVYHSYFPFSLKPTLKVTVVQELQRTSCSILQKAW